MTAPPWCDRHPVSEMSIYGRDRRTYCRACRRDRESASHFGGSRCRRGHLKTPWTWRLYRAGFRCLTCEYLRRAERKRKAA